MTRVLEMAGPGQGWSASETGGHGISMAAHRYPYGRHGAKAACTIWYMEREIGPTLFGPKRSPSRMRTLTLMYQGHGDG